MVVAAAVLLVCAGMAFILAGYRVTHVEVVGNSHYTEQEITDMVLKGNVFDKSLHLAVFNVAKTKVKKMFLFSMSLSLA